MKHSRILVSLCLLAVVVLAVSSSVRAPVAFFSDDFDSVPPIRLNVWNVLNDTGGLRAGGSVVNASTASGNATTGIISRPTFFQGAAVFNVAAPALASGPPAFWGFIDPSSFGSSNLIGVFYSVTGTSVMAYVGNSTGTAIVSVGFADGLFHEYGIEWYYNASTFVQYAAFCVDDQCPVLWRTSLGVPRSSLPIVFVNSNPTPVRLHWVAYDPTGVFTDISTVTSSVTTTRTSTVSKTVSNTTTQWATSFRTQTSNTTTVTTTTGISTAFSTTTTLPETKTTTQTSWQTESADAVTTVTPTTTIKAATTKWDVSTESVTFTTTTTPTQTALDYTTTVRTESTSTDTFNAGGFDVPWWALTIALFIIGSVAALIFARHLALTRLSRLLHPGRAIGKDKKNRNSKRKRKNSRSGKNDDEPSDQSAANDSPHDSIAHATIAELEGLRDRASEKEKEQE